MKKCTVAFVGIAMMLFATGCGDDINLTAEQSDLIAEYVAGTMLKYSYEDGWDYQKLANKKAYDSALKSNLALSPTYVPADTDIPGVNSGSQFPGSGVNTSGNKTPDKNNQSSGSSQTGTAGNKPAISVTGNLLNDLKTGLGISDADVAYTNISTGDRYPTGDFVVSVTANQACKLVTAEFNIYNSTASDMTVTTAGTSINMKLKINGTEINKVSSIIKNDITNLKSIKIASGETYVACAIFQVPESLADTMTGAALDIYSGNALIGTIGL